MKAYSKYENVLEMLRHHVNRCSRMGNLILEGERELCVRFGTSRKTLAKALDKLVSEQVLCRERQSTRIVPQNRQIGRYAYVPYFHRESGRLWYYNDQRLWESLQLLAMENFLTIDLVAFDPEYPGETVEDLAEKLKSYTMVFLCLFQEEAFRILAERLRESKVRMVMMDENNALPDCSLFAEDCSFSGRIAAETLLKNGYSHPVMMGSGVSHDNLAIHNRITAFQKVMKRNGISCPELFFSYRDRLRSVVELSSYLSRIREHGHDCVYFPLDSYLDLITLPLYEQHLVPDVVGIVSTDSTRQASFHNPPVTCTMDCYQEISHAILDTIRETERGSAMESPRQIRFKPKLIPGFSIVNRKEKK